MAKIAELKGQPCLTLEQNSEDESIDTAKGEVMVVIFVLFANSSDNIRGEFGGLQNSKVKMLCDTLGCGVWEARSTLSVLHKPSRGSCR